MLSHADRRVSPWNRDSLDGPEVASEASTNDAVVTVGATDGGDGACRRARRSPRRSGCDSPSMVAMRRGARSGAARRRAGRRSAPRPAAGSTRLPSRGRRAVGCRNLDGDVRRGRTHQHKTPPVDVGRIHYPFHPWFGCEVLIVDRAVRGGIAVFDCRLGSEDRRAVEVPAWMVDAVACAGIGLTAEPRVAPAALRRLRALLDAHRRTDGGLNDQHPFAPRKGDADATVMPVFPDPDACPRPADPVPPRPRLDGTPGGHPAGGDPAAGPDAPRSQHRGRRREGGRP